MGKLSSMTALQEFLSINGINPNEGLIKADVVVFKNNKMIESKERTVYIHRNTFGGWAIQPDDLRHIAEHQYFNTDFVKMQLQEKTLVVCNGKYKIYISL